MSNQNRIRASDVKTDVETFGQLLAPLLKDAYGMACSLARNAADAEDLVQEAALLAMRNFQQFETGTNFKAWFYRILTNCFFGKCRKEKRQPTGVDLDDLPDVYMFQRSAEVGLLERPADPATTLMEKLDVEQVIEALHALPPEYRIVCTLYFLEELNYQDIARILECPIGTVRSRLHRGRKMLQKMLWSVAEEAGIVSELSVKGVAV